MLFVPFLLAVVTAVTHTFDFNVTYVTASPDGVAERRVIGINNQWPVPEIRVRQGDRVIINFTNLLDDRNSSLHFHGLFMKNQNSMDGPEMVTQCPVPPGGSFVYNFTVEQAGTYWYHSHSGPQYSDGLRGLFIVEEDLPFDYDYEVTLTVSDWYHLESPQLMKQFLSRYNPTGAEPVPQNSLFNDTKNSTWDVQPNLTYFLRVVNVGMFVSQYLHLEGHEFTIVEVDGVLVKPTTTQSLYLSVAQRYGVLVRTKPTATENFRFINVLDEEMLDYLPEDLELVSTNYVRYTEFRPLPEREIRSFAEVVEALEVVDDFVLEPLEEEPLLPEPDHSITLNFTMDNLGDGVNYAFFNNLTYVAPKVPTLYSVLSGGDLATNARIYGSNTHTYVLQHNDIVEIVLNNNDPGKHPFHLHGHVFQVISRSEASDDDENPIIYDPTNPDHTQFPDAPLVRDTVQVNPNGFVVLRFKANNPGVWFFHCHVDWHLEQGLAITLVEAPLEIQKNEVDIPTLNYEACKALNIPTKGNAAGNTDLLNLEGERLQVAPLPDGFTLKGYVAFVVCTLAALYGVFSIYKYGMEDVLADNNEELISKLNGILRQYSDEDELLATLNSDGRQ